MTLNELMAEARALRGWHVMNVEREVRRVTPHRESPYLECPITAVCNSRYGTSHKVHEAVVAAARLGLSQNTLNVVTRAADSSILWWLISGRVRKVRSWLSGWAEQDAEWVRNWSDLARDMDEQRR